jgi:hypothetical protein
VFSSATLDLFFFPFWEHSIESETPFRQLPHSLAFGSLLFGSGPPGSPPNHPIVQSFPCVQDVSRCSGSRMLLGIRRAGLARTGGSFPQTSHGAAPCCYGVTS